MSRGISPRTEGGFHRVQSFMLSQRWHWPELKSPIVPKCQESGLLIDMTVGHVDQKSFCPKVGKKLGQGAFISARGRTGQMLKWPEVKRARGRIDRDWTSQRLKWPGDARVRGRSGQKHDVMKVGVNILVAGSCRWAS